MWTLILLACAQTAESPAPVSSDPPSGVETLGEPTQPRYSASHILVAWKGAVGAPASVTRNPAEAETLAKELLGRAKTEDFGALARAHSDDPSGRRGGGLGVYPTSTMVPAFEKAVASVAPGELGPLVRTPFGWHVVRRDAIEEVEVSHILITYAGSLRSRSERTKAEARALATQLLQRLGDGEDFEALARSHSEDEVAERGGTLGRIPRGQMVPAFEDPAFALASGATSAVVETPYGFHIIRRR